MSSSEKNTNDLLKNAKTIKSDTITEVKVTTTGKKTKLDIKERKL